LDMAMSQYSLGSMELAAMKNEKISFDGGFDAEGKLTKDPSAILSTRRVLPTGYWKGSGLALLLDILAAILAGGLSTADISKESMEYGLCQVFVAIDLSALKNNASIATVVANIIADYHASVPIDESKKVTYPGERVLVTRKKNLADGIPVQQKIWESILEL
jgi:3-dehydro-L-gulonate 2-dehydrogenase